MLGISTAAAIAPHCTRSPRIRSVGTPAESVRKSQWYDYLLSTNAGFRTYRIAKECRPIVNHPPLRGDCISSFAKNGFPSVAS